MPAAVGERAVVFNASYPILGKYRTDDDRIPLYNPANSGVFYRPGEPVVLSLAGASYTYMCQGPIFPGKTGMVVRRFTGEFPCDLSSQVVFGDEIWWDTDGEVAKLKGDVANGFKLGFASYDYDGHKLPTVAGGKVVCGTTASTRIRVVSLEGTTETVSGPTSTTTTTTSTSTTTTGG